MAYIRNSLGQFAGSYWASLSRNQKQMLVFMFVLATMPMAHWTVEGAKKLTIVKELHAVNVAEAAVVPAVETLSVSELEDRLDAIVWGGESQNRVMKEGEVLPTFDPNSVEYQECIQTGGRQPSYCISWGPRQIKLSMIHEYWPKIHGEKLTDMQALEIVNSNDASRRFFLDCAIHVTGCAKRWVSFANRQTEGQVYIDLVRAAKGI